MKTGGYFVTILGLLCLGLTLAACAGNNQPTAMPTDEPPTETPFPTFAYVEPTKPPAFERADQETPPVNDATADETVALDPKKVERGRSRYEALECGSCHGEDGEGSDKGGSLLEFAMSEDDFITFVRSGGDLGPTHQYSTDRLSNSGSRNLYQYMLSLAQGE